MEKKNKGKKKRIWIFWWGTVIAIILMIVLGSDRTRALRESHRRPEPVPSTSPTDKISINLGSPTPLPSKEAEMTPTAEPSKEPELTPTAEPTREPELTPTAEPTGEPGPAAEVSSVPTEEPVETPTPTPQEAGIFSNGRFIYSEKPMIALTFDDGPHPAYTLELLDLLEEYKGSATFFEVGYNIDKYPDVIKSIYSRGFQVANHTIGHEHLTALSAEKINSEINNNVKKLRELGIEGDIYLRPPYGEYDNTVSKYADVPLIGWDIDSEDWKNFDSSLIYNMIIKNAKDGDIVLCHSIYNSTLEAMQQVVPKLVEMGFQLVSVEEMFKAKGIEPVNGKYYRFVR